MTKGNPESKCQLPRVLSFRGAQRREILNGGDKISLPLKSSGIEMTMILFVSPNAVRKLNAMQKRNKDARVVWKGLHL
ncbi:hypothetical protein D4R75_01905 [bacterium]|nr:MAG: hypothetical protein D4R75_01905 [bacterium]